MATATPRRLAVEGLALVLALVPVVWTISHTRSVRDQAGFECRDYATFDWSGAPFQTRLVHDPGDPRLLTVAAGTHPRFSSECSAVLYVAHSGNYDLLLESDDGSEVWVEGERVLDNSGVHANKVGFAAIPIQSGNRRIKLRYQQAGGEYGFRFVMGPTRSTMQPLADGTVFREPVSGTDLLLFRIPEVAQMSAIVAWLCLVWRRARKVLPHVGWHWPRWLDEPRWALTCVLFVGVGIRALLTAASYPIWWPDSLSYFDTALHQLRGNFFSHEFLRTPFYSFFIAIFVGATGQTPLTGELLVAAQRLLGLATTVLVYQLGWVAFGPRVAFLAALVWTASPLQLYYETSVLAESVFTFLVLLALVLAVRLMTRPTPGVALVLGIASGLLALTRPVGKALVLVIAVVLVFRAANRLRAIGTAVVVGTGYLACVLPWMYVNQHEYGFFAISRGEGLGLFMRVFDFDRLPRPEPTEVAAVGESFDELRTTRTFLHYPVRDHLNYQLGFSALGADRAMFTFAREAVAAEPVLFAANTLGWWSRLFVAPHRSVAVCESEYGPHWCSERTVGESTPTFPNAPFAGYEPLKRALAWYASAAYPLALLAGPLALIGIVRSRLLDRSLPATVRLLLLVTVLYMTLLAVVFNTVEDRYRLPVDSLLALFAVSGLTGLASVRASVTETARPRGVEERARATRTSGDLAIG